MVISAKLVHRANAAYGMTLRFFGSVTEVKPVQEVNINSPRFVTLSGIVTEVNDVHL